MTNIVVEVKNLISQIKSMNTSDKCIDELEDRVEEILRR